MPYDGDRFREALREQAERAAGMDWRPVARALEARAGRPEDGNALFINAGAETSMAFAIMSTMLT